MNRLACGIDLVEIRRIKHLVESSSADALKSIFSNQEIEYSGTRKNRFGRLAARFAAKEACLKLFPQETASGSIYLRDFSVENDSYGSPCIVLSTIARAISDNYGFDYISISLSHTKAHAIAVAIAVANTGSI
jgi:holo-[acyl-carrier protein] synthase